MNTQNRLKNAFLTTSILGVLAIPGAAQSNPWTNAHTGFCTTPPPASITSFVMEHKLDVTTIQTTLTPALAPDVVGLIFSGQREVRSKITYIAATNYFNNDIFLVMPGAPLPTPASFNVLSTRFAFVTGLVDNVYLNCTPYASAMITGRYQAGAPLLGNPAGAPFAFSFGYNTAEKDSNYRFRDLAFISSGLGMTYEAYAFGTLTLPAPPPSPTTSTPPVIVLNPAITPNTVTQVYFSPYFSIDASKSTDPNGLALTYQWSSSNTVSFSPSVTSANPGLTFQGGYGDYPITLVVTNSAGISSTITFILQYLR